MSHHQLSQQSLIKRVSNAVAAGTTSGSVTFPVGQTSDATVLVAMGAIVAGNVTGLKLGQGALSNGSDAVDITGCSLNVPNSAANQLGILEVSHLTQPYLTVSWSRSTQNSAIDSIVAIMGGLRLKPGSLDATVFGNVIAPGN